MQAHPQIQSTRILEDRCPICQSANLQDILALRQIPVLANVLWDDKTEALAAPRGDVTLAFCAACGHAFNRSFDPGLLDYDLQYENSLHFSPRFQQYAQNLAQYLVDRYDLHGKTIVEIGSGKGEFLRALCDLGNSHGIGYDPSYDPGDEELPENIRFVRNLFTSQSAQQPADLVLSRHVLEHIHRPAAFVNDLGQAIGAQAQTVVYSEVPNFAYILRDTAIWDVIYEHYSYFSPRSLAALFRQSGFAVLALTEAFGEQFLSIEVVPASSQPIHAARPIDPIEADLTAQVQAFCRNAPQKISLWQDQIQSLLVANRRIVLWGAGSKGISFLNLLGLRDEIAGIVDLNPRKHNKFVTGSGQKIVPPEALLDISPDTIIVMNPIYLQEIQSMTRQLGLEVDFMLA